VWLATAGCDEIIATPQQAADMLAAKPACTDAAIEALERYARSDPAAMSELSHAYLVRAQRDDRPSDLLRAYDAADHAAPQSSRARFYRAQAEEALGLWSDAIASWDRLGTDEARRHAAAIRHKVKFSAAAQWQRIQPQFAAALHAHDVVELRRLIAPFTVHAEALLEKGLLPAWAKNPSDEAFAQIRALGATLESLIQDHFVADVVTTAPRCREGLATLSAPLLEQCGSPLSLAARFRLPHADLDAIERDVRARGYRHFLAPLYLQRATTLVFQSRYIEAFPVFDAAIAEYQRFGERDQIGSAHIHLIGPLRDSGQDEMAWREAIRAIQDNALVAPQDQHTLLGETAATASALGYPKIALRYQNAAVALYQAQLRNAAPEQLDFIRDVERNIAVALRARAAIELHLEDYPSAAADLKEAVRLSANDVDPNKRRLIEARIDEVRGVGYLHTAPARAAEAFTAALNRTSDDYSTYRASLLAQRSDAFRLAGRNGDAERDLRTVVDVLHREESRTLAQRKRGTAEDMWSSYFSRFQESYRHLIRQLLGEGKIAEAFVYAERARAQEPLSLAAPQETADIDVAKLQASLPPDTVMLEYALLDDRAITWIIGRDRLDVVAQNIRRSDVDGWSAALLRAARARNNSDFEAQLYFLYRKLLAAPLRAIGATPAHLIVVPDGAMHTIPIAALHNGVTQRYVIEDSTVEIAGSAKLYLLSLAFDRARDSGNQQALLFGDPAFDDKLPFADGLEPLPGARREVQTIRSLYAPNVEIRIGAAATIQQFITLARKSAIIDVAAHAVINSQSPSHSVILLARSATDSGALDAQTLLTTLKRLDNTRLVVLSSCSSAGGLPVGPEGVSPFVRPLIVAGVPAVVGTLWNVPDATAEELLVSFHRHYRQGNDAAAALQAAQVELIRTKTPGVRPALAWAPFEVIGHASSPFAAARDQKKGKAPP